MKRKGPIFVFVDYRKPFFRHAVQHDAHPVLEPKHASPAPNGQDLMRSYSPQGPEELNKAASLTETEWTERQDAFIGMVKRACELLELTSAVLSSMTRTLRPGPASVPSAKLSSAPISHSNPTRPARARFDPLINAVLPSHKCMSCGTQLGSIARPPRTQERPWPACAQATIRIV